jgi:hypothetical protein
VAIFPQAGEGQIKKGGPTLQERTGCPYMFSRRGDKNKQQNQSQKPVQPADEDEIRKAEIRKAVEQDMIDPNHPQGQQATDYSGGT